MGYLVGMTETEAPRTRSRGRSPSYPGIPLDVAIERARIVDRMEGRNAAPLLAIHEHWGYKPNSGPANVALAALKKFGLMEDEGRGSQRVARLTPLARDILLKPDPTEDIRAAALTPRIHRELWEQHEGRLPSTATLRHDLIVNREFTATGADEFIRQFQRTIAYARLSEAPVANGEAGDHDQSEQEDQDDETPDPSERPKNKRRGGVSGDTMTIPVPIMGGAAVTVEGQFPITEAAWTQFMGVLQAMKPGLVADEEPDAPQGS